jgi:hypothetical protein
MWRSWLVAALVLAGCGGGGHASPPPPHGSDRDQIAQTVHEYLNALADKDAASACDALSVTAQQDITTMNGGGSCEDAASALIKQVRDADRHSLRSAKVFDERIHGARATAKVTGETSAARDMPLEKQDGRWKIAGFEDNVHFTSQAEAVCITGALQTYDGHRADKFWYREGRNVFRDYAVDLCSRADKRGLLNRHTTQAQLIPLARQVIREMRQRGEIRGG